VRIGGTVMLDADSLANALAPLKPGQRVQVTVANSSGQRTLTMTLGELTVTEPGNL
jgi:S1-C subfamily serine protease